MAIKVSVGHSSQSSGETPSLDFDEVVLTKARDAGVNFEEAVDKVQKVKYLQHEKSKAYQENKPSYKWDRMALKDEEGKDVGVISRNFKATHVTYNVFGCSPFFREQLPSKANMFLWATVEVQSMKPFMRNFCLVSSNGVVLRAEVPSYNYRSFKVRCGADKEKRARVFQTTDHGDSQMGIPVWNIEGPARNVGGSKQALLAAFVAVVIKTMTKGCFNAVLCQSSSETMGGRAAVVATKQLWLV